MKFLTCIQKKRWNISNIQIKFERTINQHNVREIQQMEKRNKGEETIMKMMGNDQIFEGFISKIMLWKRGC